MLEALNSFGDFEVNPTIAFIFVEVVFCAKILRNVTEFYVGIFWSIQGCSKIEVRYVMGEKPSFLWEHTLLSIPLTNLREPVFVTLLTW